MRIASYNLRRGGVGRRAPIAEILATLGGDIVVLQEATDPHVVDWLADTLGYPFRMRRAGRSVAVLGREEPVDASWHLARPGRSFIEVQLADGMRLMGLHLSAGLSRRGELRRMRELAAVLRVAGDRGGPGRSLIAGDFNAIAPGDALDPRVLPRWIRALLRFDGGIRTEVMTTVQAAGFKDAYRRFHAHGGATLPSRSPVVRLDYAMLGPDLAPALVSCSVGDGPPNALAVASDHLPLLVVLDAGTPAGTPKVAEGPEGGIRPGRGS